MFSVAPLLLFYRLQLILHTVILNHAHRVWFVHDMMPSAYVSVRFSSCRKPAAVLNQNK